MAEINVTAANFEKVVLQSDKKVVLDFWATWCGPCMMLSPILAEIAEEYEDVVIGKVNVDEEPALAARFGIASIPTLMLFKDGKNIDTAIGYRNKDQVLDFIG